MIDWLVACTMSPGAETWPQIAHDQPIPWCGAMLNLTAVPLKDSFVICSTPDPCEVDAMGSLLSLSSSVAAAILLFATPNLSL